MRHLLASAISGVIVFFAINVNAADNPMTIAVFTKNRTNPAYEAFRIAADQVARTTGTKVIHLVPNQPDNVDEQKAMVEQVLKDRPDAVIFIPVDDVAMIDSIKKLNEAKIPIVLVSNPLPGSFVTTKESSSGTPDRSAAAAPVLRETPRRAPARTRGRRAPAPDRGRVRRSRFPRAGAGGRTRRTVRA